MAAGGGRPWPTLPEAEQSRGPLGGSPPRLVFLVPPSTPGTPLGPFPLAKLAPWLVLHSPIRTGQVGQQGLPAWSGGGLRAPQSQPPSGGGHSFGGGRSLSDLSARSWTVPALDTHGVQTLPKGRAPSRASSPALSPTGRWGHSQHRAASRAGEEALLHGRAVLPVCVGRPM